VLEYLTFRLLLLLAAVPLVVAVHELGHVLGGRLGGYYVAASGIGGGRRFWTLPLTRRFNLFVGPLPLAGGATVAFPTRLPMGRYSAFVYHYGGIVAQLLLQGGLHALYWQLPELRGALLPVIALNAAVVVANLAPYRVKVGGLRVASDGARALAAIAAGRGEAPTPQGGMGTDELDAVQARLCSPVGLHVLTVCRALSAEDPQRGELEALAVAPAGTPELYVRVIQEGLARLASPEASQPAPSTTST